MESYGVLSVNMGDWGRNGQTALSREHAQTLISKFVLGDHSHISLVQESWTMMEGINKGRFHLQRCQTVINDQRSEDAGLTVIVSSRRCRPQWRILESQLIRPCGGQTPAVREFIVRIEMICPKTGTPTPFAGRAVWTFCNFHFHNKYAVKSWAAPLATQMMIADCLRHKVHCASGDANQSHKKGYLKKGLDAALAKYNRDNGLFNDAATTADILSQPNDCMVAIVFHWRDDPAHKVRMAKHLDFKNYDLLIREGDTDAHRPMKLNFNYGKRNRTQFARFFRVRKDRRRQRKRRKQKQAKKKEFDSR